MEDKNCKRTCAMCNHWCMGIPIGRCEHPDAGYSLYTSDEMVFYDAGDRCPLNKLEKQTKN